MFDSSASKSSEVICIDKLKKIEQAEKICNHVFNILGSGDKCLSQKGTGYQKINWHADIKSGFSWDPKVFYRDISYGDKPGVDVKVPWELSRFHHAIILGQAYLLTSNKKYRDEFVCQIEDWIVSNPVACGVNWACTMDVAIRVANWLVAKELFDDGYLTEKFLEKFHESIYEHGIFIRNNLEFSKDGTNNHYIANLAGLFFISIYCPAIKESTEWKRFSISELNKEIEKQVYDDGSCFEASTSYHRLTLEMLFYCELLGKRVGVEMPQSYMRKVRKMFDVSLYCIKPNGFIPQIGDNDNGRFLSFQSRPSTDHKYLMCIAAIYYQESAFKPHWLDYDEEAFWTFGVKGQELFMNLSPRNNSIGSISFPNSGWYVLRHQDNYCIVSCGPSGQNGRGGHGHCDKLSFELVLAGKDIVRDPGTYLYTSDYSKRNLFRSTKYHNTIQINKMEQCDIHGSLFLGPMLVKIPETPSLIENNEEVQLTARIRYEADKIDHTRTFKISKLGVAFTLEDEVVGNSITNIRLNFCLAENYKKFDFNSTHELSLSDMLYSDSYGEVTSTKCFTADCDVQNIFFNSLKITGDTNETSLN